MKQKRLVSWCAFLLILSFMAFSLLSSVENFRQRTLLGLQEISLQEQVLYREREKLVALRQEAAELSDTRHRLDKMSWAAPSRSEALLKFQEQVRKILRRSNLIIHAFESPPEKEAPQLFQMRVHASGSLDSIQSALYYLESNVPGIEIKSMNLRKDQGPRSTEAKLTLQMHLRGKYLTP